MPEYRLQRLKSLATEKSQRQLPQSPVLDDDLSLEKLEDQIAQTEQEAERQKEGPDKRLRTSQPLKVAGQDRVLYFLERQNKEARPKSSNEILSERDLQDSIERYSRIQPWEALRDVQSELSSKELPPNGRAEPERSGAEHPGQLDDSREIDSLPGSQRKSPKDDGSRLQSASDQVFDRVRESPADLDLRVQLQTHKDIQAWQAIDNCKNTQNVSEPTQLVNRVEAVELDHNLALSSYSSEAITLDSADREHLSSCTEPFVCFVPVDVGQKLEQLGPLEPETMRYLHDEHAYLDRHLSTLNAEGRVTMHANELAQAVELGERELQPARDKVCAERSKHAELQIEELERVEEGYLVPSDSYVAITYRVDLENVCYEFCQSSKAIWTRLELMPQRTEMLNRSEAVELEHRLALSSYESRLITSNRNDPEQEHSGSAAYSCILPIDVGQTLAELGPLEPETMKYLHDEYGYLERYVDTEQSAADNRASTESNRFAQAAEHAECQLKPQRDELCPERNERGQAQIEHLEKLKEEIEHLPRFHSYVVVSCQVDEKNHCYELQQTNDAKWTRSGLAPTVERMIEERATPQPYKDLEQSERAPLEPKEHEKYSSKQVRASSQEFISKIEKDLLRREQDLERLIEDEPAAERFCTVRGSSTGCSVRFWSARTIEEFDSNDPGIPATPAAIHAIVHVDRLWKLWVNRVDRSESELKVDRTIVELERSRDLGSYEELEHDDCDR